jgi:hypothetical protein
MKAKQAIKAAGYKITNAGHWIKEDGTLVPVTLIQIPYGGGITIGGDRRQVGRKIKRFARSL